jgi:two-component system response regulator TctD
MTGEVWCNGVAISLRRGERRLLTVLMRRSGRVVPKPMIESNLSGRGEDLSPNAVEQMVSRLRKALSEVPARSTIRTVRGAGYVLMEA